MNIVIRKKFWFYNPVNDQSILCFPDKKSDNYIKDRKTKKGGGNND